jgi:hypothetical protein
MRAYVAITGVLFGLLTIAHLVRAYLEGARVAGEPVFIVFTVLSLALCIWAGQLIRGSRAKP